MNAITIKQAKDLNKGKISKLSIKKLLLTGSIIAYECDQNWGNEYVKASVKSIIDLWDGFHLNFKYNQEDKQLKAYLGTSFVYKFTTA